MGKKLEHFRLKIQVLIKLLLFVQVAARNMFNPPMEILAARDHMMHVVYSFIQPSRLLERLAEGF